MEPFRLLENAWPAFSSRFEALLVPGKLHHGRITALQHELESNNFSHAVVYADREHFANLHFLTNFDPRFEEAVLLLGSAD